MKKTMLTAALAVSVFCATVEMTEAGVPPVEFQVSLNNAESEFFTVEVKGTAYERGFQHGAALRKVIRPTLNRFKYDMIEHFLTSLGTDKTYQDYKTYFYSQTGLFQTAMRHAPELVAEIRGIADGASLAFEDVFIYNLNFDETFWVLEAMTGIDPMLAMEKSQQGLAPSGHCSHGSVWGEGKVSIGYTLDWTRHFEGSQALIKHVKEDGTVLLMTTYAGTLIGHGINATQGYTFTPHSKFQLAHDVQHGLAQIFIYRKLLEAGSVDQAVQYLQQVKPAAGLAYALSDKNGTRTFEVSANQVAEFKTDGNWMAVANVARANNDLSASYQAEFNLQGKSIEIDKLPQGYWAFNQDSVQRFALLEANIAKQTPAQMGPQQWQALFSQKPLNKPVDSDMATSNLWHVVEIDEHYIDYHVSAGNPGNLPLEPYRFMYNPKP
ncbi:C45 family autoproteolytic acyltransferase/hydolase [Motilimonas pumila]|uniref:Peptidase C45 hydrolase domain-containing protein n=1 Tax=Motilimonas pumila TaxID=2303987 RepID=A0A418YCQ5_9GAMM|nr:C45 family peptidase [Motilimonas pumila]RJG42272.1 hypothetical protein D1Z90_14315 [Motilimonas pumila]